MVLRLLQRLFVSRRIILLTVELNGLKKMIHANNLFTLSCELGLERHFQIGFFLMEKKYPNTFGNENKTHRKMWKNMEITKKKCEMTREVS